MLSGTSAWHAAPCWYRPELILERNNKSALEVELSLTEQLEQQLVFVLQRFSEGLGVERK